MNLQLETNRLLLRPLELSDVDAFFAMNNNPDVNAYLRNPLTTRVEVEQYVQKIINEYQKNGMGRFAVILKETNKLIGFSGLKFRATAENNHIDFYDLGYRFGKEYWRKGFATEAARAWLDYGFNTMKLSTIYACAVSDNSGSNIVLKKLGFEFMNDYITYNSLHSWYKFDKQKFS
ncbi:GNAT family N-acetyltransferase [Flavobacterium phycosphaerae]|uniref:GNAT family N-acetyltransferase n=1 Tax=Flavobacterium phycosphaerae TaxID=2697515 RepID=UPI00138A21CE|nr:GNAT family N-acetyltransferase [Flavobacterium phycosphaerae]